MKSSKLRVRFMVLAVWASLFVAVIGAVYWMIQPTSQPARLQYALSRAIQCGESRQVADLLNSGANPNKISSMRVPPINIFKVLHMDRNATGYSVPYFRLLWHEKRDRSAPENEMASTLKALLDHGANPNASDGFTPLIMATRYHFSQSALLLISHGAMVDFHDTCGLTAMHYAAIDGDTDIVQILVRNHANINVQDDEGYTPLMYATREGNNDTVSALMNAGANINSKNRAGDTALDIARRRRETMFVHPLPDTGGSSASQPLSSSR